MSFDWENFLKRWSREIIASIPNNQADLPPEVLSSRWLGYPGATEDHIARAEARLGTSLPPSYRAFLKVTNGWRQTSIFSNQLWSTDDIDWFSARHRRWIEAFSKKFEPSSSESSSSESSNAKAPAQSIPDDDYFVYGDEQDCSQIRVEYLQTALEISQQNNGAIYLLNPQIVTPDGEWEAWFFGDWLPGADRYRSFQDMMQAEYENFLELRDPPVNPAISVSKPEPTAADDGAIAAEISPPSQADSPKSDPSADEAWRDLASFSITLQTRSCGPHHEQRSIIHHLETDAVEILPNGPSEAIQQWMLKQIRDRGDQAQPEDSVELTITQLRVIRSPRPEKPMVVNHAHPLFEDAIQSGEPFALEVSMNVFGEDSSGLAEGQLAYRAKCTAHHLSTQLDTDLGDITTHVAGSNRSTYTAQFPEARLKQPGLYRLKVWVTLQNVSASPGYFKVPMLQVV